MFYAIAFRCCILLGGRIIQLLPVRPSVRLSRTRSLLKQEKAQKS